MKAPGYRLKSLETFMNALGLIRDMKNDLSLKERALDDVLRKVTEGYKIAG